MDCIGTAVTPRRGPQSGRCHRSYKIHLSTKYGLHWDAVISRWAREHANEVGALDVTKKSDICKYIAVFIYFSSISFEFSRLQNYYIFSDFANFRQQRYIIFPITPNANNFIKNYLISTFNFPS